jgi:hypothetical protein
VRRGILFKAASMECPLSLQIACILSISENHLIYPLVSLDSLWMQLFGINIFDYASLRFNMPLVLKNMAVRGAKNNIVAKQLAEEWTFGLQNNPLYDEEENTWFCCDCGDGPHPLWQDHCASCQLKKCGHCRVESHPKPRK